MVTLLAGTSKGLFRVESDPARTTWRLGDRAHEEWEVYRVWGDTRTDPPTLWAGLSNPFFGAHLERSRDLGRTWEPAPSPGFPEGSGRRLHQVWSFAPAPGGGLLAGVAEAALFRSEDGAEWKLNQGLEGHPTRSEWSPGAGGLCAHSILPDPAQPDRLYVGISAVGVFRSDDGGRSWAVKNQGVTPAGEPEEALKFPEIGRCVHSLVQDPTDPTRLYQQNHTGVYRSVDAGDHWERIEEGLPSGFGFPMVAHPTRPGTLFIAPLQADANRTFREGRAAIYRTDDGGDHWQATTNGLRDGSY
ncbi:MAG: exo-alpha-sialidase, partial [Candidatus Dormibacteraeota bacterium]|nr:exo-alpha-sialidase [Candidatus Dormibacteraeota bacterium]